MQLSEARAEASSGSVADLVFIAGGSDGTGLFANLRSTIEVFNVTSKTFLPSHTMSAGKRDLAVATTDDNKIAFFGGIVVPFLQQEPNIYSKAVHLVFLL